LIKGRWDGVAIPQLNKARPAKLCLKHGVAIIDKVSIDAQVAADEPIPTSRGRARRKYHDAARLNR
jgi:hypothetical protein